MVKFQITYEIPSLYDLIVVVENAIARGFLKDANEDTPARHLRAEISDYLRTYGIPTTLPESIPAEIRGGVHVVQPSVKATTIAAKLYLLGKEKTRTSSE